MLLAINMTEEIAKYRSVERRIWDGGARDFCGYGAKALYGMVVNMFRFPTFFRKALNEQLLLQRVSPSETGELGAGGILIGSVAGLGLDSTLLLYALKSVADHNYTPLAIWGGTNLVSGIFELGRLSQSRREHSELVERVESDEEEKESVEKVW